MSGLKNVNDLIRIGDAISVLCRKTCHPGAFCPDAYCDEMWDEFDSVERITVEPQHKTGKWIERNPQNSPGCRLIECSECGNAYIVGYNIDYDDWIDGRNFCMRCGADLRRGSNGEST